MDEFIEKPRFLSWEAHVVFGCCLLLTGLIVAVGANLKPRIVDLISELLEFWLSRKYSIRHAESNTSIPGCRYRFPNGQGDAAKFLHGKSNSEKWGSEYGPVFRIWSGMAPEIVLTRPEHVKEFFKDSHLHEKANSNNSGYFMSQILGQCLGLVSGSTWRAIKETVEHPFVRTTATNYWSLIEDRTTRHFEYLKNSSNLASGLIDPAGDFKLLPFLLVADIIYGPLTSELENRLIELAPERERLFHHVLSGGLSRFHWSRFLPTKANKELAAFRRKWHELNDDLHRHALSRTSSAPIIRMHQCVAEGKVSKEELFQTLDEMLFANLDVTVGGVSWNLVFLAANPAVTDRLRREVLQRKSEGTHGEYLQDRRSYLAACVCEASRLRPLAAFTVPQAAPTDRLIGGYLIPAGTHVVVDAYALNIRNAFWGPDNETFRPERFFGHTDPQLRYNYWRFGFGPRQCLGRYVADLIIRTLIAHIVVGYDLSMAGKEKLEWGRIEDCWINHPDLRLRCVARG